MQTNLYNQDMVLLETLIDRRSLHTIFSMIAEICALKEHHIAENWRDPTAWFPASYQASAKIWRTYELKLDKLAINCPI